MSHYIWTRPTARRRHRCRMCWRSIPPGEDYDRMAGFDAGDVWTYKVCRHCFRVADAWTRWSGESEWAEDCIYDFLSDEHPALYAQMRAGWRYPDGELVPLPFQRRCFACATLISDDRIWCQPCDVARIERLSAGFEQIKAAFA